MGAVRRFATKSGRLHEGYIMKSVAMRVLALGGTVWLLCAPLAVAAEPDEEKIALGKEVFLERAKPACGLCHTLADAGTEGSVGPVLDDLKPDAERVRQAVVNGVGPMRPYKDLSEEEVDALAVYIAAVTGGSQ